MIKALFINGSPRKNGNTAQLLKRAMDGAREAGAEVELVSLYDRSLNYKGCMSCFACKIKGGKKGICSFKDDLKPFLEKAIDADVLICGSPVYCHYPSANFRAFMERLIFPAVNYSDFMHPIVLKPKHSAALFTMNCPSELQRRMPETSERVLAQQLKELVEYGVVEKQVIDPVCKHSEYSLTDLGRTLIPIIEQLRNWGNDFRPRMEEILKEKE